MTNQIKNIITESLAERFINIAKKEKLNIDADFETIMLMALAQENKMIERVLSFQSVQVIAKNHVCKNVYNKLK